jgi:hypothetical protein
MDGGITFVDTVHQLFWHVTDVLFRWMPATAAAVTGTNGTDTYSNLGSVPSFVEPIYTPVTTADISTFLQASAGAPAYQNIVQTWGLLVSILYVFSFLCLAWLTFSILRLRRIRKAETLAFAQKLHSISMGSVPLTQLRWQRIEEQVRSDSEQAWRLAILEADGMLNELLDVLGYKGHTMMDKMRQAERVNFKTIDLAWEAHRMRNHIVHQGEAAGLTAEIARQTIAMYEHVFKEFRFLD